MDNNYKQVVESRAIAICEEFCRYVVVDSINDSILTNTSLEYYDELLSRMKALGYIQIFVAAIHPKKTITSTFLKAVVE